MLLQQHVPMTSCSEGTLDVEAQSVSGKPTRIKGALQNRSVSGFFSLASATKVMKENLACESNDKNDFKGHYRGKFPWIYDSSTYAEYKLHERSFFDIYQCIIPSVVLAVAIFTRFNIYNSANNGPYFNCSLFCVFFFTAMFPFAIILNSSNDFVKVSNSWLCKLARKFHQTWLGRNHEDVMTIVVTLMIGFVLYGRVTNGQCDPSLQKQDTQSCNPAASSGFIPPGQVLLLYLAPVVCQTCFRGVRIQAVFFAWAIGVSFIVASVVVVGGWHDLWSLIYSSYFLHIIFSFEKFARLIFLESKRAALVEKNRHQLLEQLHQAKGSSMQKEHELELISIQAQEEKRLMDKEREQLTALIGNVAHDLKTPLQSFVMDLELLKTRIIQDYKIILTSFTDDGDTDHPLNTLRSLNSACDFMRMAINRSIDFAKASGNIALVPAMETFNIVAALSIPVNVIKHLQSAINIVVSPLPDTLCENLISDKHWFSENVLCLLSNAVKYSDGGTVTVSIELLEGYVEMKEDDENILSLKRRFEIYVDRNRPLSTIRVNIEDTGIGLSKNARDNLFQPFKQAQRLAGGTGLGLFSLSKRTEALGGSRGVDVRKDGKRGSNFWFTFPYRPDWSPELHSNTNYDLAVHKSDVNLTQRSSSSSIEVETMSYNLHVLLVDDSFTIIQVVGRALRKKGYQVTTANNGSAGLDRMIQGHATQEFDFVLMDLQMPIMDGIEAVRRYREFEREEAHLGNNVQLQVKRLAIIGMSANSDNATKQCALDAGSDFFIGKPFNLEELRPIINQICLSPTSSVKLNCPIGSVKLNRKW